MLNESRTRATAAGIVIGIAAASSRLGSIDSPRQPTTSVAHDAAGIGFDPQPS